MGENNETAETVTEAPKPPKKDGRRDGKGRFKPKKRTTLIGLTPKGASAAIVVESIESLEVGPDAIHFGLESGRQKSLTLASLNLEPGTDARAAVEALGV